jgi:NAD(P)-dependent dehydrogenase (short-subunit alcohol dehydrogenase family)
MKRSGGGSVINMSSATGISGSNNGTSSYCASKGGIAGLTKAAALEFRAANVRVNSVHPGFIWRHGPTLSGQENSASFRERMKSRVPLQRIGEPTDIANVILYLASDESRHVTGGEFVVDGGYLAA